MKSNLPISDEKRFLDPLRPVVTKTDLQSRISYANPAFIEISGFGKDELLGQPHNVVRHPHMPSAAFADLWRTVKGGRAWQGMVKNRCKDGAYYWVDAYVTPVKKNGDTVGYMSVRSAPTAEQIQAAEALYRKVQDGNTVFPATPPPPRLRFAWLACLAAIAPALSVWLMAVAGFSPWISLALALCLLLPLLWITLHAASRPLQEAERAIAHIAEGNLKQAVATRATREFNALLSGIESMRVNLRAIIADAVSAADEVGHQAVTLKTQTGDLTARSNQQTEGVAAVATVLEHLSSAIGEITDATRRSAVHAESARSVVQRGMQEMGEVQQASAEIGTAVDSAQGTIRNLQQAVQQIGAITQTIKEIADQTNLLALNAAIEAARAGEQGRGFAVVADEVRKLSERTAASTNTIASTISAVQDITRSALTSMQDAVTAVATGQRRIDTTRSSLHAIGTATDGVARAADEIAGLLAQQSQASGEVAANMEEMSAIAEQNGANVRQVADSATQLSQIANDLHALLNHFEGAL